MCICGCLCVTCCLLVVCVGCCLWLWVDFSLLDVCCLLFLVRSVLFAVACCGVRS